MPLPALLETAAQPAAPVAAASDAGVNGTGPEAAAPTPRTEAEAAFFKVTYYGQPQDLRRPPASGALYTAAPKATLFLVLAGWVFLAFGIATAARLNWENRLEQANRDRMAGLSQALETRVKQVRADIARATQAAEFMAGQEKELTRLVAVAPLASQLFALRPADYKLLNFRLSSRPDRNEDLPNGEWALTWDFFNEEGRSPLQLRQTVESNFIKSGMPARKVGAKVTEDVRRVQVQVRFRIPGQVTAPPPFNAAKLPTPGGATKP
jgi:hypothetical protein